MSNSEDQFPIFDFLKFIIILPFHIGNLINRKIESDKSILQLEYCIELCKEPKTEERMYIRTLIILFIS